jgi:hypothetical protein
MKDFAKAGGAVLLVLIALGSSAALLQWILGGW